MSHTRNKSKQRKRKYKEISKQNDTQMIQKSIFSLHREVAGLKRRINKIKTSAIPDVKKLQKLEEIYHQQNNLLKYRKHPINIKGKKP